MFTKWLRTAGALALAVGFMSVSGAIVSRSSAQAAPMIAYALTTAGDLVTFEVTAPGTIINSAAITGLPADDRIVGFDIRPATGQLFAESSASRMYVINPTSGMVSGVGNAALATPLSGANFGFDFNPTVDRIRATSDSGQNLRLNPNNGAIAAVDGVLAYGAADQNAGAVPVIVASAYTNNFNGAGTTVLYNIDAALNLLVSQNPPNDGRLNTIGALGIDAGANTSFDIYSDSLGSDVGYAAVGAGLYQINLANGAASFVGTIGSGTAVQALALAGSMAAAGGGVPICANFDGSTSPVVRVSFTGDDAAFCRVLYENRQPINGTAGAQIGNANVLNAGVIQAVDIFRIDNGTGANGPLNGNAQVCLLGTGNLVFLNAAQSPRVPVTLVTSASGGYTCGFVNNTGTVVLTSN